LLEALAKGEIAMRIRSAGLAALVAAAGIWMSFSGAPAMAAKSNAKTAKPAAQTSTSADRPIVLSKFKKQRAHAARKSRAAQTKHARKAASKVSSKTKVLAKKSADKPEAAENKAADKPEAAENKAADASKSELPASVANARAQALAADQARNIAALDSTDIAVVDGIQLAADDPAGSEAPTLVNNTTVAQDTTAAPAVSPPTPAPSNKIVRPVPSGDKPVFKTGDSDPWSKTSLIGKIFIAFGGLLTLASAARLMIS
jgi:hypothetical protein